MSMFTVIGRGHSGTRIMSYTLSQSGVFMGEPLNSAGDLVWAPGDLNKACRILANHVHWHGGLDWDFSNLQVCDIPDEFIRLTCSFLKPVLEDSSKYKGWKYPETLLIYPWIARLFPEIYYIYWIRNPRDCILGHHWTDDLAYFGVSSPSTEDMRLRRAISWKYQYDLVRATPRPKHWIEIRFEDFVLQQDETLARLEDFCGFDLVKIPVQTDPIDRWREDEGINFYPFLAPAMVEYDYKIPRGKLGVLLGD